MEITIPNPYRPGSKLSRLYDMFSDGEQYSLQDILQTIYWIQIDGTVLGGPIILTPKVILNQRKRVTSAIRTIRRQKNGVHIVYFQKSKTYQMSPLGVEDPLRYTMLPPRPNIF